MSTVIFPAASTRKINESEHRKAGMRKINKGAHARYRWAGQRATSQHCAFHALKTNPRACLEKRKQTRERNGAVKRELSA